MQQEALKKLLLSGGMLGVFGVGIFFAIYYIKKNLSKSGFAVKGPSSYVMAMAFESVLKGQETFDELGKLIFDALMQGNFSAYRAAHASIKEIETFLDADTANKLTAVLKNNQQMRAIFDRLRDECLQKRASFMGVEPMGETPLATAGAVLLKEPIIYIGEEGKAPQNVALGPMLKGPFGWKLLPKL